MKRIQTEPRGVKGSGAGQQESQGSVRCCLCQVRPLGWALGCITRTPGSHSNRAVLNLKLQSGPSKEKIPVICLGGKRAFGIALQSQGERVKAFS